MNQTVSVMTPCYNSAEALPIALASLLAQSYENWECLLIDDGSTDNPQKIVTKINDPRIKYFRLKKNMGRAFARQKALELANGEYLTMLDSDDWLFPDKIRSQIKLMQKNPKVCLISSGMAIIDSDNQIVGASKGKFVNSDTPIKGPFRNLIMPPIAHAPSMIRMELAKNTKYDLGFSDAEDVDFLIKVLLDRRYYDWPIISYAYRLNSQANQLKMHNASREIIAIFKKHALRFPIKSRIGIIKTFLKAALKIIAFNLGLGNKLIANRYRKPSYDEIENYRNAWQTVSKMHKDLFE